MITGMVANPYLPILLVVFFYHEGSSLLLTSGLSSVLTIKVKYTNKNNFFGSVPSAKYRFL